MPRVLLIAFCLCALLTAPASAVAPMTLVADGKRVETEVHTINGAAMVPFKPALAACGVTASWVEESHAISAYNAEHAMYVVLGQKAGLADGYQVDVDPPAQFIDGHLCIPLRLIVKAFQFQSMYDGNARVFHIFTKPSTTAPVPAATPEQPVGPEVTVEPAPAPAPTPAGEEPAPAPAPTSAPTPAPAPEAVATPAPVAAPEPTEPPPPSVPAPSAATPLPSEQAVTLPATLVDGSALVSLRRAAEAFSAGLQWIPERKAALLRTARHSLQFILAERQAAFDGSVVTLPAAPQIVENVLLVPARILAAAFDGRALWDGATKTVTIAAPKQEFEPATIHDLLTNPKAWAGRLVSVAGRYGGREATSQAPYGTLAPPPWGNAPAGMIKDDTGAIFFTGAPAADLSPETQMDVPLMVSGLVRLDKVGSPYVEIAVKR